MATFYSTQITADTNERDISDYLAAVMYADQKLIGQIPIGEAITDMSYMFEEETGIPLSIVGAGGYVSGGDHAFAPASAVGALFLDVGTRLQNRRTNEVIAVSVAATDDAGTTMQVTQVTAGHDYTSGASNSAVNGDTWDIMYFPRVEGSTKVGNKVKTPTVKHQMLQTFRWDISMTRDQQMRNMHAISDFWGHNIALRTGELKRGLLKAALYGTWPNGYTAEADFATAMAYVASSPSTRPSTMLGFRAAMVAAAGDLYEHTSQPISQALFNRLGAKFRNLGADNDSFEVWTSPTQAQKVSAFDQDKIRYDYPAGTKRGGYVNTYLSDLGVNFNINYDYGIMDSDMFVFSMDELSLNPFTGAAWFVKHYDSDFDGIEAAVIGEWMCLMRDAGRRHALVTALTV